MDTAKAPFATWNYKTTSVFCLLLVESWQIPSQAPLQWEGRWQLLLNSPAGNFALKG